YSAIDQIAQFGLSSLKVIYYSEQLFRRSGEEVDMEVYMFAEIDDSGRFIRIEEATLMLKGRESDRDLGSVR
ncbi:hypothetical protein V6170_22150, partial [Klebsiella pneumoniae]